MVQERWDENGGRRTRYVAVWSEFHSLKKEKKMRYLKENEVFSSMVEVIWRFRVTADVKPDHVHTGSSLPYLKSLEGFEGDSQPPKEKS